LLVFAKEVCRLSLESVNYLVRERGKRAKRNFDINPHMFRHSNGYYLANKGYNTRLIQDYPGHKILPILLDIRALPQLDLKISGANISSSGATNASDNAKEISFNQISFSQSVN
jgi:hypothetical protein